MERIAAKKRKRMSAKGQWESKQTSKTRVLSCANRLLLSSHLEMFWIDDVMTKRVKSACIW
jgi:hypothetical protein